MTAASQSQCLILIPFVCRPWTGCYVNGNRANWQPGYHKSQQCHKVSLSLSLLCPNLPVALRSGQCSVVMLTFPNRLKKENVYCHLYSETLLSAVDSQIKEKLECKHLHHHKKYIIIITVITHYVNLEIFQKARSVQTF